MRALTKHLFLMTFLVLATACKKEVEKIVVQEVDKVYSWSEIKRLYGTDRVILNTGKDANSIYLQTPGMLGILSPPTNPPTKKRFGYYVSAGVYLPTDVTVKIPIARDFFAFPIRDTLVQLSRTTEPVTPNYNDFINLRQVDKQASGLSPVYLFWMPFGAVDRNNFLLFSYYTPAINSLAFVLAKVNLQAGGYLQAQPQAIKIALSPPVYHATIRWIVAIDNYFLANCGDAGLYKIQEDGTARRVFGYSLTDACYKWQGVLYAVEEYNSVLTSKDDGETWQRSTGTPDAFNFTSYHVIGDSLVGVARGVGNNYLFTLRWNGPNYRIRALKNDGLGQGSISGIEQLGDTVYVGTTSGLFKRPLSKFFESK